MEKASYTKQASQLSKSGIPPLYPEKASFDKSEIGTADNQLKSNSRFGHRLSRFMDSADILGEQDVDGKTQQTNDARYNAKDFQEDSDQYMMTKIKSS